MAESTKVPEPKPVEPQESAKQVTEEVSNNLKAAYASRASTVEQEYQSKLKELQANADLQLREAERLIQKSRERILS